MTSIPEPRQAAVPEREAGPSGSLPGTEHTGLIFTEYVDVERSAAGTWGCVASGVPAAFAPVSLRTRVELSDWTHRPLLGLWLLPDTPLADGDRIVRADGSRWYVRGAPLAATARTHLVALVERETEDGLFAPMTPG